MTGFEWGGSCLKQGQGQGQGQGQARASKGKQGQARASKSDSKCGGSSLRCGMTTEQEQQQIPPLRCGMTSKKNREQQRQKQNAGVLPLRRAPGQNDEYDDGR
jgi:hypothetical protein